MRTRHNAFASPPLPSAPRPGDTTLPGAPAAPPFDHLTNRDPALSKQQSTAHSTMARESPITSQQQFLSPSPTQEALFLPAPQFTNPHPGQFKSSSLPGAPVNICALSDGTLMEPADNVSQPPEVSILLQPTAKTQGWKRTKPADTDCDAGIRGSILPHQAELAAAAGDSDKPGPGRSGGPTTGGRGNGQLGERTAGTAESSAHVRVVRQRKNSATVPAPSAATAPKYSCSAEADGTAAVAVAAQRAPAWRKHAAAAAEMNPTGGVQERNSIGGGAASRPGQRKRPRNEPNARASRRVSFAEGPLKAVHGTADGHPPHEGQQFAARVQALSNDWGSSLTPGHMPAMEAELGPENAPSVERLKRRLGLLPPIRRLRIFTNARPIEEERGAAVTALSLLDRLLSGVSAGRGSDLTPHRHAALGSASTADGHRKEIVSFGARDGAAAQFMPVPTDIFKGIQGGKSNSQCSEKTAKGVSSNKRCHAAVECGTECLPVMVPTRGQSFGSCGDPTAVAPVHREAKTLFTSTKRRRPQQQQQHAQQAQQPPQQHRPIKKAAAAKMGPVKAPLWQRAILAAAQAGSGDADASAEGSRGEESRVTNTVTLFGSNPNKNSRVASNNSDDGGSTVARRIGSLTNGLS